MIRERIYSEKELQEIPLSSLAWLGDAVYEIAVRDRLLQLCHDLSSGKLFRLSLSYVSASAQARALRIAEESLSEEEREICRRARNHEPSSRPRGAAPVDYRYATALEVLLGRCWLAGEDRRLEELLSLFFQACEMAEASAEAER